MQHSRPTLAFKPLTFLPPTSFLLPLHRPTLSCFWPFFYISCFLSRLTPSGFFKGMTEVFEPEVLSYYTLSRLILWILSVSRNPTSTHLPLSGSLDSLLCDLIAPTPGLAFFFPIIRTLAVVSTFSLGKAYPSLNFLTPLSSFNPYSDYVGVSILPNNSSSLSFLKVYTPPIYFSSADRTDSLSPSSRDLFILEKFNCHHPLWDSTYTSDPCGKYSIGSSPLISHFLMTLTHVLFSTAPLSTSICSLLSCSWKVL